VKYFARFSFDEATGTLFRGGDPLPLTRKAGTLLRCLTERAGTLVTHGTILAEVWPDTHVQPDNIKVLIRELRRSLQDDVRQPRFIRSEPGKGYVFIATPADRPLPGGSGDAAHVSASLFNARATELARFQQCLSAAAAASSRLVLVEGDRGVGKTLLCDAFLRTARSEPAMRMAYGQCVQRDAAPEPFSPVLDALEHLTRQFPRRLLPLLERHAPNWRARLPPSRRAPGYALAPFSDDDAYHMTRELKVVLEELSRDAVVLLLLEDLQWGDLHTVNLLRALARHHQAARFVVVATYAPLNRPISGALRRLAADLRAMPSVVAMRLRSGLVARLKDGVA